MIAMVEAQTLLVFVGIPLLVISVVTLLVYAPSIAKGPRYRPGLSWWAPPVWIGGPDEQPDQPAAAPALAPGPTTAPATGVARTTGGASASW